MSIINDKPRNFSFPENMTNWWQRNLSEGQKKKQQKKLELNPFGISSSVKTGFHNGWSSDLQSTRRAGGGLLLRLVKWGTQSITLVNFIASICHHYCFNILCGWNRD